MKLWPLLHQNTSASSSPCPFSLQSSSPKFLASRMSYQLLWHLILPHFHVFSTSWCFTACLDNLSMRLCLSSQAETSLLGWHNEVPSAFTPHTAVQELVSLLGLVLANSSCNPAAVPVHSTVQVGAQLLPASTDHPPPLLLLPYRCIFYICLQQPVFPLPCNSKPFSSLTTTHPPLKRGI